MRIFKANEITDQRFYQVPKSLFNNPRYQDNKDLKRKALTLEGKMAYSILRDRLTLSIKNNWVNENDEVFLKFKRADLMQLLECSKTTIAKIMKELQAHELIFEKRLGRGMTNEIYICHVDLSEIIPIKPVKTPEVQKMDFKKSRKWTSRSPESGRYSDTDIKETDSNETTTKEKAAVVVPSATPKETDEERELVAKAEASGIKKATIQKHIKQKGLSVVAEQVSNLEKAITEGNKNGKPIVNPGAWLHTALEEGFIDSKAVHEQEQAVKKAEAQERAAAMQRAAEEALLAESEEAPALDPSSPFAQMVERLGVMKAM